MDPLLSFGSTVYTNNSEFHVTFPRTHVKAWEISFNLIVSDWMTVSQAEMNMLIKPHIAIYQNFKLLLKDLSKINNIPRKIFQIPQWDKIYKFDVSHLISSYPRISKLQPALFTNLWVFFLSYNNSIITTSTNSIFYGRKTLSKILHFFLCLLVL